MEYISGGPTKVEFLGHRDTNSVAAPCVLNYWRSSHYGGALVDLAAGELFVVPKGVRHNPVAREECLVMLVERKSTLHSGDVVNERTRSLAEQLRPV